MYPLGLKPLAFLHLHLPISLTWWVSACSGPFPTWGAAFHLSLWPSSLGEGGSAEHPSPGLGVGGFSVTQ